MAQTYRVSADGQWWGGPGYWMSAVSADGAWRWDGSSWSGTESGRRPDCLETLDPQSLQANRRGRLTLRQVARLGPRLLWAMLFVSAIVGGTGCATDLVGLGIGLLLAAVSVPVVAVLVVLEWALGASREEGPLSRVYDGRRRTLYVAKTAVSARGANIDRMVDGATHRIYFTRVSHSLINYERLGGDSLAAAETRALEIALAHPKSAPATVVAIWADALQAGRLPQVCAKSGRTAGSKLTFWFVTRGLSFWVLGLMAPGRRANGPLPLTKRWRAVYVWFRVAVIASVGVGVASLLASGLLPDSWKVVGVSTSLGAFVLSFLAYVLYAGLRPKGDVYANARGELYVVLSEVHPSFVKAVIDMGLSAGDEGQGGGRLLPGD